MVYIKRYAQPSVSAKELGVCSEPLPTNVVRTAKMDRIVHARPIPSLLPV